MNNKRVIIVGLFPDVNAAPITQASELAKLLNDNDHSVIKVSRHRNKWLRLLDIIFTLLFRSSGYDVAIVQFYSGNSFIWQSIAASIIKALNKKLVFTIHGGGVPDAIQRTPEKYLSVLRKADAITVPSAFMQYSLKGHDLRTQLIHNTIPLQQYPFYKKDTLRPVLLWMRSFSDIYDPLMAVQVVYELKKTHPEVKMYMGGIDMGLLQQTRDKITSLDLTNNIEIAGFMNFEDKKHYAQACDIYISTNRIDNAPVTFLEMWAMGLPVVSTNVGGVPFLVNDGVDSLLVNDKDAIEMADKIRVLLSDNALAKGLVEAGRNKVAEYDECNVYPQWHKLLSEL